MNLQTRVFDILKDNRDGNGGFMSIHDIAREVYGEMAYIKETYYIFNQKVKNSMGHVKQLANLKGIVVVPHRKENPDTGAKRLIDGYKIAVPGMDDKYIAEELEFKQKSIKSFDRSYQQLLDSAKEQGLLPHEILQQLEENIESEHTENVT